MVCTTVTIGAAKPVITLGTPQDMGGGQVYVPWTQDIAGSVIITLDGGSAYTLPGQAGNNSFNYTGVAAGTHTICVEAA